MKLDANICYQALLTRDARFDGCFFVGVATTGIYCRPVCPAKPPAGRNCSFFPSAAAAEAAGFRPCLRCRPELAPGASSIEANANLARRAADLIETSIPEGWRLSGLADRLGVTDRHLRRVFRAELGASPLQFAQTHRLLLAKRLLTDTSLSITDVAMGSGFSSIRRFNALMKDHYRMSPTDFRRKSGEAPGSDVISLRLGYRPPMAWEELLAFLGARAVEGVESISKDRYRRSVGVEAGGRLLCGWIEVICSNPQPLLEVVVGGPLLTAIPRVLAGVKRLFDLSAHPVAIASVLGPLALDRPGLRVPGAFDGFEIAVRAILGQQISVKSASTLAARFTRAFGEPVDTPFQEIRRLFPKPARIADCTVPMITALGITSRRAVSLIALAGAVADGSLRLDAGAHIEETLKALLDLPGVGVWTAQYVAMRALAWPDAFPHSDYGVMKALRETSPARVLAMAEKWRPWRAYAAMHLWAGLKGGSGHECLHHV